MTCSSTPIEPGPVVSVDSASRPEPKIYTLAVIFPPGGEKLSLRMRKGSWTAEMVCRNKVKLSLGQCSRTVTATSGGGIVPTPCTQNRVAGSLT